jgi:hypothetical protein
MSDKELLYIISIAKEGSVSKAAKKLYIAQPSLSQALKRIEKELNTKLFIRGSKGLKLSTSGEYYYKYAKQILKLYEEMKLEIADIEKLQSGSINLGTTNHLSLVLLPKIISEFSKIYPNIDINITENSSNQLFTDLEQGNISFAIMHLLSEDRDDKRFCYEILSKEDFLILVSDKNPVCKKAFIEESSERLCLDIKDIRNERFIMLFSNQRIRQMVDLILKKANMLDVHSYITIQNFISTKELVRNNLGVTILPESYAKSNSDEGIVYFHIPRKYQAFWRLCIAYDRDGFMSKADRAFFDLLM